MATLRENSWPQGQPRAPSQPTAVIFDIDNCLADDKWRIPYIMHGLSGDEKYESYHRMCFADKYAPGNVATLLEEMERGHAIFFVTARPQKYRAVTEWWLQQLPLHGKLRAGGWGLHMRPNDDKRPTREVKRDAVDMIRIEGYHIERAYDDRRDVVDMYKRHGIQATRMLIHEIDDCEATNVRRKPEEGVPINDPTVIEAAFADESPTEVIRAELHGEWPVQGARPVNTVGLPDDEPVLRNLVGAMNTFAERNAEYKGNYEQFGKSFLSLFPGGVIPSIIRVEDANRLQVMIQLHNKMMRYASNFGRGGHKDSARDIIVYGAMLEEFTK